MTPAILEAWDSDGFTFLCRKCCFSRKSYNFRAALLRLKAAFPLGEDAVTTVLGQERLLMKTFNVQLPPPHQRSAGVLPGTVDRTAKAILEKLSAGLLEDHTPLKVFGDGNCLYRALSRVMYGTEDEHELLRFLTAMEIATWPKVYDQPGLAKMVGDKRIDLYVSNLHLNN